VNNSRKILHAIIKRMDRWRTDKYEYEPKTMTMTKWQQSTSTLHWTPNYAQLALAINRQWGIEQIWMNNSRRMLLAVIDRRWRPKRTDQTNGWLNGKLKRGELLNRTPKTGVLYPREAWEGATVQRMQERKTQTEDFDDKSKTDYKMTTINLYCPLNTQLCTIYFLGTSN
jgi:hypothetical protein